MKLFTIGYERKSAEEFFELLINNQIECVVDIRILPNSDDAGFASQRDLPYLLKEIAGCDYKYMSELAPTLEMLDEVHQDHDHNKYAENFAKLMVKRDIPDSLDIEFFEKQTCCLMCFEKTPEFCHRQLVTELFKKHWGGVEVIHL